MTIDPATANYIYGALGVILTSALHEARRRWRRAVETRPLYENGKRQEIIQQLRRIEARLKTGEHAFDRLEDRIATLEADREEDHRIRNLMARRLKLLESEEAPES